MGFEVAGLSGLIIFVLNIYAIVKTLGSSTGTMGKVLWIAIILLLPLVGFLIWFLLGPKGK